MVTYVLPHAYAGPMCAPGCTLEPEEHPACPACGEVPGHPVHHGATIAIETPVPIELAELLGALEA